jgi:hypothetical protein
VMRIIELDHDKLLGYTSVGADDKRIAKRGSAKIGEKWVTEMAGEVPVPADRVNTAA